MGVLIFGWCDSEFNKMSLVDYGIGEPVGGLRLSMTLDSRLFIQLSTWNNNFNLWDFMIFPNWSYMLKSYNPSSYV